MTKEDPSQQALAANKAKPKCGICGGNIDKSFPPCKCAGRVSGGGGSGSGGVSAGKGAKNDIALAKTPVNQIDAISAINSIATPHDIKFNFDPAIIMDLIAQRLLEIKNDKENGILTIKGDSNLSADQKIAVKEFINAIINEFKQFKSENDLSAGNYKVTQDKDGLSLQIWISDPVLYAKFIHQLSIKDLLIQNIEPTFRPTPFPTTLKR